MFARSSYLHNWIYYQGKVQLYTESGRRVYHNLAMSRHRCIPRVHDTDRYTILWGHNELDGISNHQPYDCLLNRLFGRRSKKTSKLRVTGLWEGNSPVSGEFPAQQASNAENVSFWWRHHDKRWQMVLHCNFRYSQRNMSSITRLLLFVL